MTKSKNVYYNKQDEHGNGKYRTGQFPSAKNKSSYIYRSSYEYAFFTKLEADDNVVQFISEPFQVPYTTAGDPFTAGIAINFNTTANGFDVGRSYAIGEIMQVAFDTRGGNVIQNITFESPIASTIGPFTVDA